MRFILDGGAVVVDGVTASTISTAADPTTGNAIVQVVDGTTRRDVTQQIHGGAIGADIQARDKSIAGAAAGLDQLAYDIATQLNAVHASNAGLDGASGRNMFVQPTQVAGAAASMAVDPALDADPSKLAAAAPGAGPGDNTGALALYNLASQGVAAGGKTLGNAAIDLATSVGTQASNANSDAKGDQIISDHLAGLRDSLSGVDVQEELTNLSKFQNASSAMTKLISTIDAMLGDFISKV
jgi:flagellar hook-associated protein 1 FlgK